MRYGAVSPALSMAQKKTIAGFVMINDSFTRLQKRGENNDVWWNPG